MNEVKVRGLIPMLAILSGGPLLAQADMPLGMFKGIFVSSTQVGRAGELFVRGMANAVFGCHYDDHSLVEEDSHSIPVAKLAPGDPVQVLADHKPGSRECYARIVEVLNPAALRPKPKTQPVAAILSPLEFTPRGDRTLTGIVLRRDGALMLLRTPAGDQELLLRRDTRYVENGAPAASDSLKVNVRCSVRAGRDLDGKIEAYQVMWGNAQGEP